MTNRMMIYCATLIACIFIFIFIACKKDATTPVVESTPAVTESTSEIQQLALDTTSCQTNMAYVMLYNALVNEPYNYIGKLIKFSGTYSKFTDPIKAKVYHSCNIPDTVGCCTIGCEFETTQSLKEGEQITVTGILSFYVEDNISYYVLKDAEVVRNGEAN